MSDSFDHAFFSHLWERTLLLMKQQMSDQSFETWFGGTEIVDYDPKRNRVVVFTPNTFVRNWLEEHYAGDIGGAFLQLTDQEFEIAFITGSQLDEVKAKHTEDPPSETVPVERASSTTMNDALNSRYTFDTFVIGASNRFTHAACLAVAEKPGHSYNPLFIYGGVGLGKTHLMHAIGHFVHKRNPTAKILYISTEKFTNDFITSIRENSTGEFRNRYRSIDVLLVDDIQFIARKESTQEEFFHTFNALHQAGKQLVISSDCPPREIPTLEDRLRSRFEWGLLTDIQPPDLETRIAILQRKAKAEGLEVPADVNEYIANQIDTNIRELEGALIRVIAYSSLVNQDVTLSLAEEALKDILVSDRAKQITVSHIQRVIADHFGLRMEELSTKKRTKTVVFPRQVAMYLTRELTSLSLPKIGQAFGGRDHTTVMHACDKVIQELDNDQQLRLTVDRLTRAIKTLH